MKWSIQQQLIFKWFEQARGRNLVVRARAGTGKTTTAIEALNHAFEAKIMVCAFNKKIADEFNARIKNGRARASTLHSLGYACVRRHWNLSPDKDDSLVKRADTVTNAVLPGAAPDVIRRLVTKLHTKGREIRPHARRAGDLEELLWKFECNPDESWEAQGYDAAYVERYALAAMEYAATVKPPSIDFADMIFLPVRNRWMMKQYDMVVVDEAQDMTEAQLELAMGICRGRFVLIGDDRQAIYDFRGADSGSLDRLKAQLNADELGLTVTYRCGQAIVDEARKLVPDFEAGPTNPPGEVRSLAQAKLLEEITEGDFLLSRVNAPLVAVAMSLLRANKRARIAGRDIGASLKTIIKKLPSNDVNAFLMGLDAWEEKMVSKFLGTGAEARVALVRDQAETLRTLAEGADAVSEILDRIEFLFTDYGLGAAGIITCSSVHRAKGLEANRVFVLASTLRKHNQEELNIQYVAITRAKQQLTMVY